MSMGAKSRKISWWGRGAAKALQRKVLSIRMEENE
jgi:hypothetical protein